MWSEKLRKFAEGFTNLSTLFIMKKTFLFLFVALLISNAACAQVIQNCIESRAKYEKSLKYETLTPVTVDQMSEVLKNDDKIKIVIQYSPCDPKVLNYIEKVVLLYWNKQDKSQVSLYLIATDCGYLQNIEPFFVKSNLDVTRYYFRDNSPKFCMHTKNVNINRDKDIQRALFVNADSFADFSSNGIKWFVASKENFVKLAEYADVDLKGEQHQQQMPIMIESLPADITTLNFLELDTSSLPKKSYVGNIVQICWTYKK